MIVRRRGGRLVGAARGRVEQHGEHEGAWDVGRLMVAPDLQGQGLGRDLLARIEGLRRPPGCRRTSCSRAPGASTTSGCTRRPAIGCEGPRRVSRAPWCSPRSADFARIDSIWQTRPLVLSAKLIAPEDAPGGIRVGTCHRGSRRRRPVGWTAPIRTNYPRLTCGNRGSHHDQRDHRVSTHPARPTSRTSAPVTPSTST